MRILPIGISSFEEIRSRNYYYVDKTHFVKRLVDSGKYFFLSRPRRFGKSLFVDTLKQAFLGKKELFEGLYLYNNWNWNKVYPVIHIDFGAGVIKDAKDLEETIRIKLHKIQEFLGVSSRFTQDIKSWFEDIIIEAYKKYHQKGWF